MSPCHGYQYKGDMCYRSNNQQIPLWTEHDVVEALRDMAKGKWGQPHLSHASDGDFCCVQAFVKSVELPVVCTKSPVLVNEQRPPDKLSGVLSELEVSASLALEDQGGLMADTTCAIERQPTEENTIEMTSGAGNTKGQSIDRRYNNDPSDRREGREPLTQPGRGGGCQPQRALDGNGTERPIFYRAAWKSNGRRIFVWKIMSRSVQKRISKQ